MTPPTSAVLDSDTLSEVIKGRDAAVQRAAREYLDHHGCFQFSLITRYEILRGLFAKEASRQIEIFERQCQKSTIFPLSEEVVVEAARLYGVVKRQGLLIGDADLLIAATALVNGLRLVTENADHFRRIPGLSFSGWRAAR